MADGALAELTLDPGERGKGHGSRLLQAAVDTLVADRFTRAVTWLLAGDDDQRRFLTEAGWAADGAHRELDLDGSGRDHRQAGAPAHRHRLIHPSGCLRSAATAEHHGGPPALGTVGDPRGVHVFGPLPVLHRVVIVVGALTVWIGLGLWSALVPYIPVSVGRGHRSSGRSPAS